MLGLAHPFLPLHLSRSNNRLVTGLILVLARILVPFRSKIQNNNNNNNKRQDYFKSHFTAIASASEETSCTSSWAILLHFPGRVLLGSV